MNHQTKAILEEAKKTVADQGAFTDDQITLLHKLIDKLGEAIAKEAQCASGGPCCN